MQRIYLKDRSFSVETLPSEISLLVELIDLCHNDDATFEMFSQAIKKDPALTAKFLKMANSPLYRQWNEISDLKRMLIVLGLKNIRKIILTSSVQQFFSKLNTKISETIHRLWLRSLVCAHLAEKLAGKINYQKAEEAYLTGLLHQIGVVLLLANYGESYQQILEQYDATDDFSALEQSNYGLDHCEVGAALVESWQLDSLMSDAILFQHASEKELTNSPDLLRLIAAAGALASPLTAEVPQQDIDKAVALLQVPQETIIECLMAAQEESRKVLSELGFGSKLSFPEAIKPSNTEKIRAKKAAALAQRIKNMTLTACFFNGTGQNPESFVTEIRLNFALLFNLNQLVFINLSSDSKTLAPFKDQHLSKLNQITFSTEDQSSTIVKSFTQRSTLDSTTNQGSIADNQIIRGMGTECAYFLPVYAEQENLGVIAIGTSRQELALLKEKLPLIELLVREIGLKYFTLRRSQETIPLPDFNKIVHEVKNPLTIINNYLFLLGRKLTGDHSAQEEINFIKNEMDRVGTILAEAGQRDQQLDGRSDTDINRLLNELNSYFDKSLYDDKKITSVLQLDASIPILQCAENKLKQVIINIIKNAVEALPQAGEISIITRDHCFQNGQQFVEIAIKDNGPGIPVAVLKNLFQPIESTKKGHSGLGLSIVSDLISELCGNISCYSNQQNGTEFKILLPRLTAAKRTE